MSLHHVAPAGSRQALRARPEAENAEIHEIYPGASAAAPLGVQKLRRPGGLRRLFGSETGMATAEYAIATLAAVGFAGILVFIMRSDEVRGFLLNLIRTALALP
ncbi:MAG: DUF4244 domain-containing protein [Arthrobacter sp.]|nr:DUF4244 domain-containing protein [Arthrobacter sp.]MDZ4351203.1 DUF4244 domain-containing protein [Arthrobacter sp.]